MRTQHIEHEQHGMTIEGWKFERELPIAGNTRLYQKKELHMKQHLYSLFLMVLLTSVATFAQKPATDTSAYARIEKFDPKRDAAKDIQNAIAEARRTTRRVLLDVGGEWCVWCRKLDTFFVKNKDVADSMHANYVVVKVNFSKENENEAVLSKYPEIKGYPHIFVLDRDGTLLYSQDTGELESGKYHDREKVLAFLKKWAPTAKIQK